MRTILVRKLALTFVVVIVASVATRVDAQAWKPIPAEPFPPTDPSQAFRNVTCKWNGSGFNTTRCLVNVRPYDDAGTCKVEAPNINLQVPGKDYIIIWQPTDAAGTPLRDDYRFCPLAGDGVSLKDLAGSNDEQFDDRWSGNMLELGSDSASFLGKACFARTRIKALNNGHSKVEYNYEIVFHRIRDQKPCKADPFIRNG